MTNQTDLTAQIEVNSPHTALDVALTGTARVLLPTFIGDAQQQLQRVSPVIRELDHDQWLVAHQDDRFIPEVRKTIDRIVALAKTLHGKISSQ